jgi:ATP-dependent Clp protease ATP-binding subunit ClpC
MFEAFTEKAIKSIILAQEESRRLGHNFVGTEQILLGLLGEGSGIGARALQSAGVTLKAARVEVEKISGRGNFLVSVEIPFTEGTKGVFERSFAESQRLGKDYVATEHILLGIIRKKQCVAIKVLEELGVSLEELEKNIIQLVDESK